MGRQHRRQSDRTALTRKRLIDAAIERLLREGMTGTTVVEICRAADVTTGALQHHFGSKAGLMATVVDTLFSPFADIQEPLGREAPLAARIERLVENHWRIYKDERYFAVLEVLLATRHDPELRAHVISYRDRQIETLSKYLEAEFPDVRLPIPDMIAAVHRVIDLLRGYSIHQIFERSKKLDQEVLREANAVLMRSFGSDGNGAVPR